VTVSVSPDLEGRPAPFCALCGRPMEADQEWCLECGAARTIIARPPDWRVPLLVVALTLLLIAGGLVFAISQLSDNAGRVTVINETSAQRTSTLAVWQPGEDGYTVLLAAAPSQSTARSAAIKLQAADLSGVGILAVAQHPQMRYRGPWLIFSGRYPTYALAHVAAVAAVRRGQSHAVAALVQRPGQG
jgi:hypothetical protein